MTRLPLDFPPLLEMAEVAAREWSTTWVHARAERGDTGPWLGWDHADNADQRETETAVQAALLSDLTRPESQALWLRWLAERLGAPEPDVGGPTWERRPYHGGRVAYALAGRIIFCGEAAPYQADIECPALDNPDSADAPIRALVLAVLTVGGAA